MSRPFWDGTMNVGAVPWGCEMAEAERRDSPADAGTVAQIVEELRKQARNLRDLSFICAPNVMEQAADLLASPRGEAAELLALVKEASEIMTITYAGNFPAGIESFLVRAANAITKSGLPVAPAGRNREVPESTGALPCGCGPDSGLYRYCDKHNPVFGTSPKAHSAPLSVEAREQAIALVAEATTLRGKVALCSEKICARCDVFRAKADEADAKARALLNLPPTKPEPR